MALSIGRGSGPVRAWLGKAIAAYLSAQGRTTGIGFPTDTDRLAATLKPGETLDLNDPACRHCVQEILHVRNHSLFVPRDFDLSPYFQVIKPGLSDAFDPRALLWANPSDTLGACAVEGASAATSEKPVSCGTTERAQAPTLRSPVSPHQ